MNKLCALGRHVSILLLGLAAACAVSAHDARPVVLTISESAPSEYRYVLTVPDVVMAANAPAVSWPAGCRAEPTGLQRGSGGSVTCNESLQGREIALSWPAANPSLSAYIRFTAIDTGEASVLLSPSETRWQVPGIEGPGNVFVQYFRFGVEHLLLGYDHLLFVLGLLVVAGNMKRILLAVTGFTLSHSLSLGLSALNVIVIPVPPVEAVIALSILYLAVEIARNDRLSAGFRFPVMVAFLFGLLHGLGFASVLGDIGLADNALLFSLFSFNLGIEAGQVAFVLAVIALVKVLSGAMARLQAAIPESRQWAQLAAAWVIGVPSAFWFIERVSQFG